MIPTPTTFHVDQPNRTWIRSRILHRESAKFSVRQPQEEKTQEANVRPKKKKKKKERKKRQRSMKNHRKQFQPKNSTWKNITSVANTRRKFLEGSVGWITRTPCRNVIGYNFCGPTNRIRRRYVCVTGGCAAPGVVARWVARGRKGDEKPAG